MKLKAMPLILFLILPAFAPAQTVKILEPTRVKVMPIDDGNRYDQEIARLLRSELNQHRDVIMASHRMDFEIHVAARPIENCSGYTVVMMAINPTKLRLSLHTGNDLTGLARHLAARLDADYLKRSN